MAPFEYEEKTIRGRYKQIKDQLRQAVLEGWMPYCQAGVGGTRADQEIMVHLVRAKQPQLRKVQYLDPDNRSSDRIA